MPMIIRKLKFKTRLRKWTLNLVTATSIDAGYVLDPKLAIIWLNQAAPGTSLCAAMLAADAADFPPSLSEIPLVRVTQPDRVVT